LTTWDPDTYLGFAAERLRPSLELVDRVPQFTPAVAWDLGCGTGHITEELARRWPNALIFGLDSSREMLQVASQRKGNIEWTLGDIEAWNPRDHPGLILATASLQWLPDHERLFPRLLGTLAPGGIFAVQMPRNYDEPSHRVLAEVASSPKWRDRVGQISRPIPVAEPRWYHDLLAPHASALYIWETVYYQRLTGDNPVAAWAKGTAARPHLEVLGADGDEFMGDYAAALREAYPPAKDGVTLFPFRRIFILATRTG
jgi:trans-aconitate 2-methyltransferase